MCSLFCGQVAISALEPNTPLSYDAARARLAIVRERLNRPLTLGEKVLYSKLEDPKGQDIKRGSSYLRLLPDRVAMQVRRTSRVQPTEARLFAFLTFFFFLAVRTRRRRWRCCSL